MRWFSSGSRFLALGLMVVLLSVNVACSSKPVSSSAAGDTTNDALIEAPESGEETKSQGVTNPENSDSAEYEGTDPDRILEVHCALSGCHGLKSLQLYSADAETVSQKIESMSGSEYSNLSESQKQALLGYYLK